MNKIINNNNNSLEHTNALALAHDMKKFESHRIKSETVMTSITYIVNYCANKQTKNKSLFVIIVIIFVYNLSIDVYSVHCTQYASKVAMHRARIEIPSFMLL